MAITRRTFLSAAAASAASVALTNNFAHAAGSDRLRVGLIGAGGRGCGAAKDCVSSTAGVEITAIGEMFPDRLEKAKKNLADSLGDAYKVADDHCFLGFDAYQKVLATDVDMVILATPPGFRPMHIRAAAEAGKHIFAEKPVATDPVGVRSVIESGKIIAARKLGFLAGTQRRHHPGYIEIIKRIHDGAIGEVLGGQCYWCQNAIWFKPHQPEWSDLEWQLSNWEYFTWLSGDHIVEQHIHNIDVMNWAMGGPPVSAYGMGGRQVRTDPVYGHIFDHFAIEFTYASGVKVSSMCRQIDGTASRVTEMIVGSKGIAEPRQGTIKGDNPFKYAGETRPAAAMKAEHADLIGSIREGKPLNDAQRIAETTLTAIMGRMSAYTGKEITFEQAMGSKLNLFPEKLDFAAAYPTPDVAVPGKTPLI